MHISDAGLSLIRTFEGLSTKAYKCPAGIWTIGYGHTAGVKEGQVITEKQAEDVLKCDLFQYEKAVSELTYKCKITQSQFDAMVCFAYNVGIRAFNKSTLLFKFRMGDIKGAADEFLKWNKAKSSETGRKIEVKGLTLRRQAERRLFLSES